MMIVRGLPWLHIKVYIFNFEMPWANVTAVSGNLPRYPVSLLLGRLPLVSLNNYLPRWASYHVFNGTWIRMAGLSKLNGLVPQAD